MRCGNGEVIRVIGLDLGLNFNYCIILSKCVLSIFIYKMEIIIIWILQSCYENKIKYSIQKKI